jgi:hypothetical protein
MTGEDFEGAQTVQRQMRSAQCDETSQASLAIIALNTVATSLTMPLTMIGEA